MGISRKGDQGKQAVSIMAVAFVMVVGLMTCLFLIVSAVEKPQMPSLGCVAAFAGLGFFLWWIGSGNDAPAAQQYGWLKGRKVKRQKVRHRLEFHRKPSAPEGVRQPPDANSIREIRQRNNVWVPSGSSRKKP